MKNKIIKIILNLIILIVILYSLIINLEVNIINKNIVSIKILGQEFIYEVEE